MCSSGIVGKKRKKKSVCLLFLATLATKTRKQRYQQQNRQTAQQQLNCGTFATLLPLPLSSWRKIFHFAYERKCGRQFFRPIPLHTFPTVIIVIIWQNSPNFSSAVFISHFINCSSAFLRRRNACEKFYFCLMEPFDLSPLGLFKKIKTVRPRSLLIAFVPI